MSPLAIEIYKQLIKRVRSNQPSITYAELAGSLGKKHATHPRSPKLHAALGEVTQACRHSDLPALPAIVWRSSPRRPGGGYYKIAHPRAHTEEAQLAAWEREHARVISEAEKFPPTLS
jgi:hypothetical protein